jgi:two-component system, cell cycle sensor histidine kinase and response regulator CckA
MKTVLRVLFVEDSEDDTELARLELEHAGFELDWLRVDTEDGFSAALRQRPWQVIISDYQMPAFDGLRAFTLYRKSGLDVPFIFVSGALGEERAVEAMRGGARDYIMKGNLARLGVAVHRELQQAENRRRQREAEESAQREQRCLAMAMEATGAGIAEFTLPLQADTYITGRWRDFLGYAPEDIPPYDRLQLWLRERIHPDDHQHGRPAAMAFYNGGEGRFNAEFRMRHKNGNWVDVACMARAIERDSAGRATRVVVAVLDLTERKKLEVQMRQAQKMEAVGRLAGGVAHDFNNILTVILGYADLLRTGGKESLSESIEQIQLAAKRAAELTKQLLAFSRRQIIAPKVLNLNVVVSEMSAMIKRLIGEDIEVQDAAARNLWNISADAGQVEQVVVNLAVNARDAMPKGGKLTLETCNVELDDEYCRHRTDLKPGEYVMLGVSDTGTGMDEATKAQIFEPFFTTKAKGKGTGLGLATVYGVVKQNGGHIAVYSELGKGTTFKVYWPRALGALSGQPTGRTTGTLPGGNETILVVEDEDQLRKFAVKMLRHLGYKVIEASNGMDALEQVKKTVGVIDLLVTDVIMPKLGGHELAHRLVAELPHLKVLYTSGYTANAIVHQGVIEKGINFLAKPYTLPALAGQVRTILDSTTAE